MYGKIPADTALYKVQHAVMSTSYMSMDVAHGSELPFYLDSSWFGSNLIALLKGYKTV